ncbi:unnamed protein product [Dibothriocephalus latus]|uniref:Uncharacterized protein n=1 Tax=Dibothriocephalus latus TaxID=60516 RepID=A0A3P7NWF9_DIBLA|nr:unnamed protein product [Dibothriocephalus latus]
MSYFHSYYHCMVTMASIKLALGKTYTTTFDDHPLPECLPNPLHDFKLTPRMATEEVAVLRVVSSEQMLGAALMECQFPKSRGRPLVSPSRIINRAAPETSD